jgi:hypothetical protein
MDCGVEIEIEREREGAMRGLGWMIAAHGGSRSRGVKIDFGVRCEV